MDDAEQGQADSDAQQKPPDASSREEHRSYLLRLWRAGVAGGWRASLQSVPAGERHMFADLESLLAFLKGRL